MTDDERAGIEWWNSMTKADRSFWLAAACTAVVAEAWAYFKRQRDSGSPQSGRNRAEVTRGH